MFERVYRVLFWISLVILAAGGLLSLFTHDERVKTFGAVLAGVGASLLASCLIQRFASQEQALSLREITLQAAGIHPLPDEFRHLQWFAYATRITDGAGKKVVWYDCPLRKVGGTGLNFVQYEVTTKNPKGEDIRYNSTFVGGVGCVVNVISKGNETGSVVVFDVPVEEAGVYFGVAYLTDWLGDRDLSLGIVGAITRPHGLEHLPQNERARFEQWFRKIDWSVQNPFDALPQRKV